MTALVAGVDASTQSTKVELRDLDDGTLVASAAAPHPATAPPVSEQDPVAWWQALVSCCARLRDHLDRVAAISVAGQQHGLVLVDAAGQPVAAERLRAELGRDFPAHPVRARAALDDPPATLHSILHRETP